MIDANGRHRPDHCTDDVLEYIISLYAVGTADAAIIPSLQVEFGFSRLQADQCRAYYGAVYGTHKED